MYIHIYIFIYTYIYSYFYSVVFAPCQGHHFVAFRIMESMGLVKPNMFMNERHVWEKYLFTAMRASIPTGAVKIFHSTRINSSIPFGHPGNDGWTFTYLSAFTSSPLAISKIWYKKVIRYIYIYNTYIW